MTTWNALLTQLIANPPDPDGAFAQADVPSADLLAHISGGLARQAGDIGLSAVTAARDAISGDLPIFDPVTGHVSDEAFRRANEMAGLAMTGSVPFEVPAGALRTFGGRAAATADRVALDRAATMQSAGADPGAIWRDTGWGFGRDGAARFEIPDDAARLRPRGGASGSTLGGVLDHPALFEAYPELRDVNVFHRPELGSNAAANPSRNWIALNLDDPQALDSLLHEGQHVVQRYEGFAPGASPVDPALAAHPQVAEVATLRQRLAGLDAPQAAALADRADQAARLNAYRTAAGEVEARNVEVRQAMTPAERSATPPWQTQDVPADRQWLPQTFGDAVTGDAAQLKVGAPTAGGVGGTMPKPPLRGVTGDQTRAEAAYAFTAEPAVRDQLVQALLGAQESRAGGVRGVVGSSPVNAVLVEALMGRPRH